MTGDGGSGGMPGCLRLSSSRLRPGGVLHDPDLVGMRFLTYWPPCRLPNCIWRFLPVILGSDSRLLPSLEPRWILSVETISPSFRFDPWKLTEAQTAQLTPLSLCSDSLRSIERC